MARVKYRVLVVKYKDVPKNLYSRVFYSEDEALKDAQAMLQELAGDAAIVTRVDGSTTEVLQRFEWAKPTGARGNPAA
jgi:hypothetical protein